jgi:AraC-like DNA-binding protein
MQQQSLRRSLPLKPPGNMKAPQQQIIKMEETSDFCHQVYAHQMSQFHLTQIQWQGAFQLKQELLADQYIMYIVLAGSLSQKIDLHQICCSSSPTATMVCPGQTMESIASEDGQALLISIDRVAIDLALNRLLDRPAKQPLIFQSSIDLSSKLGLSLKKFSQFLWSTAANAEDLSLSVMQKLEQTFLDCVIEGLPHNYSEALHYQNDNALAGHVRKALAFIENNLHEDIKLRDIAAAASVCSRLLQKAFSHHCGCSPMRFLTQTRLQRIRQELEQADPDTKIVNVMMQYGFTQGGKFAKEYQQLFGEKPSDTLKRRAQPQPLPWQEIDDQLSERVSGGRFAQIRCFTEAVSDRSPRTQRVRGWEEMMPDSRWSLC